MNETTRVVRELYEQFPYPSGEPEVRLGFDPRFLLSLSNRPRPKGGTIRVLDAGCGRAIGLIGAASVQRDIQFVGIDLNRVALAEARVQLSLRGLDNVELAEGDLEIFDSEWGTFDVIHSSGVIHHLTDPRAALEALGRHLAPHGVLALMVYGWRDPIQRVVRVISALTSQTESLSDRLGVARELIASLRASNPEDATWKSASEADDVEFVDRYLHPRVCSYDVDSLFDLIESSGLRFLRWADPDAWNPNRDLNAGALAGRLANLDDRERFKLAEAIHRPGKLEVYLCQPDNRLRTRPASADFDQVALCAHPEISFELRHRAVWCDSRIEHISTSLRGAEAIPIPRGPVATAAVLLAQTAEPFLGCDMLQALCDEGLSSGEALEVLEELFERELIYAPHAVDVQLPRVPAATV